MIVMHQHGHAPADDAIWLVLQLGGVLLILAAASAYSLALWRTRDRGRWPWWRTGSWLIGLGGVAVALIGPVADAARTGFTAHMSGHLLLGMIAPLLLVLAAPLTLALRALPVRTARTLSRVMRSLPVRVMSHPLVAVVLNAGGLWVLYTTQLYHVMHTSVLVHVLVHTHILCAGLIFTAALISPDPNPHRASLRLRTVVLVGFIAAHSILGKWLYAYPPAGVEVADARVGAQLMYYGGDVVDVLLLVLLFAGWYPFANRQRRGRIFRANPGLADSLLLGRPGIPSGRNFF